MNGSQFIGDVPVRASAVVIAILAFLLAASTVPYTPYLPQLVAYALIAVGYGAFLFAAVMIDRFRTIFMPTWALVTVVIIWTVYLGHLIAAVADGGVTKGLLLRVPSFVLLTGLNLFFFPRVVSRSVFFGVMARVSAVIVLIGLPTLFVRQVPLGLIEVVSERGVTLGPLEWNALSSIFRNPNTMSYLAMVGLIAGIGEYVRARTRLSLLLVVINGAGLFLSHSRGALLGAGVALTVLALHRQLSWLGFQCVVVFTASLGVYAFAVLVGSLPGPEVVRSADLSGRLVIWRGGFEAVLAHPLFGLGPGNTAVQIATFVAEPHSGLSPHNSYLRVFIDGGLIAGMAYLLFIGKTVLDQLLVPVDRFDVVIFTLCVAIAVSMLFQGFSLFGISILSLTASVIFGYGIAVPRVISSDTGDGTAK